MSSANGSFNVNLVLYYPKLGQKLTIRDVSEFIKVYNVVFGSYQVNQYNDWVVLVFQLLYVMVPGNHFAHV